MSSSDSASDRQSPVDPPVARPNLPQGFAIIENDDGLINDGDNPNNNVSLSGQTISTSVTKDQGRADYGFCVPFTPFMPFLPAVKSKK